MRLPDSNVCGPAGRSMLAPGPVSGGRALVTGGCGASDTQLPSGADPMTAVSASAAAWTEAHWSGAESPAMTPVGLRVEELSTGVQRRRVLGAFSAAVIPGELGRRALGTGAGAGRHPGGRPPAIRCPVTAAVIPGELRRRGLGTGAGAGRHPGGDPPR